MRLLGYLRAGPLGLCLALTFRESTDAGILGFYVFRPALKQFFRLINGRLLDVAWVELCPHGTLFHALTQQTDGQGN